MAKGFATEQEQEGVNFKFGKGNQGSGYDSSNAYRQATENKRRNEGKNINNANRHVGDFQQMELNNLMGDIQREQARTINVLKNYDFDGEQARYERIHNVSNMLNLCYNSLRRGLNANNLIAAVTPYVIMSVVNPEIKNDLKMVVFDTLAPFARTVSEMNPKYKSFYDTCMSGGSHGHVPYTPMQAAQAEIALDMKFYNDIRKEGLTENDRNAIQMKYNSDKQKMLHIFSEDGVSAEDLRYENHKLVAAFSQNPETAKYFNSIFEEPSVDLTEVEKGYATHVRPDGRQVTSTVYRMPEGGFSYEDGSHFPLRFGPRMPYAENQLDDIIFKEMKGHYGAIHKAELTGDKSYMQSEEYLKSMSKIKTYRMLAHEDGFTDDDFDAIYRNAMSRSELHYFTKDPEGIKEYNRLHPEEAKQNEEKPKEHIKIKREKKDYEWNDKPSSKDYKPYVKLQESDVQNGFNFNDTVSDKDLDSLSKIMCSLEESVNGKDAAETQSQILENLKKNPEVYTKGFLDMYRDSNMSIRERHKFDIIDTMLRTDKPVLNSDGRLVATRCIGNCIDIGDVGGYVRGDSYVDRNCWVDKNSHIDNTKLRGNVVLTLNSGFKDSEIVGNGVFANTNVENSKLNGAFNPFDIRKETGVKASPINHIDIKSQTTEFGFVDCEDDSARNEKMSIASDYAMKNTKDFKNKTVKEYSEFVQAKYHAKQTFKKNANRESVKEAIRKGEAVKSPGHGSKTIDITD